MTAIGGEALKNLGTGRIPHHRGDLGDVVPDAMFNMGRRQAAWCPWPSFKVRRWPKHCRAIPR